MSLSLDREASVFNFCLRTVGSRDAAAAATKAAFLAEGRRESQAHLLAAARRECAGLVEAPGVDDAPESSLLRVHEANGRLQARYREVLALRELLGCSYEEIAAVVGADRGAVAELLWQARLELRDQLQGSTLRSIAPLAKSCRRGLALIVMNWDGELHDADERKWLQRHLRTCGKCRMSQEAARQASASYREWPAAATPLGMRESLLDAAESRFASDSERPAAGSGKSSRSRPDSPPRAAPRGARRSPP